VTPEDYKAMRDAGTPHFLLDVREPEEFATARIEGGVLVPLSELGARLEELPRDRPLVVMCHHGIRSAHAVHHLRAAGYDARNLTGGIDAWSRLIDRKVPIY
jgi:sulfur-carrier protein adenylyltransferase/sulfurtransferase